MTLTVSAALLLGVAMPASAATYAPGFSERVLVSGLTRPMQVAWAPDGRMFVIQKDGLLKVVAPGSSQAVPVRDFSLVVNGQLDRGLLGLAVDSDFADNQYVYLLYTYDLRPGGVQETEAAMVSQLRRIKVNPLSQSSPADDSVILGTDTSGPCPAVPNNSDDCIPSDGRTHSIGTVRADPDGTLWVGSGDGFTENTNFPARAYDEESMAGKIMHIDRDGRGLEEHPFCPNQTNTTFVCTRVHAKGFRNPFRFSLRPGGGLVVGDVGWTMREEIDLVDDQGGKSYGWPCLEGTIPTPAYAGRSECTSLQEAQAPPAYDYPHVNSNAVVGGPTYTGGGYPGDYVNSIFFGDFTGGFIHRLVPTGSGGFNAQPFATDWHGVALETAPNGDLVSVNPVDFQQPGQGTITRIDYSPPPAAPPPSTPPAVPASVDRKGPRLRLKSVLPRRGRLSGTATDSSGVRKVMVALRRQRPRGGCTWWLRGKGKMSTGRRRCDRPRWMTASLERVTGGVRWSVRLRGKLPPGTFRVLVRATDRKGNVAHLGPSPANLVRVRKP